MVIALGTGADLEAVVLQCAAQIVLGIEHLTLQQLARCEQHPPLLALQGLDVQPAEQADPHHLGDARAHRCGLSR
jgi:hypothetical protein